MKLHPAIGAALAAALLLPAAFAQPGPHSYLGIGVRDIDNASARKFALREVRGAEVTSVADASPASKAGFQPGDVVLEFNGQPVEGGEELTRMVRETPVGRQVRVGVWRNGAMQTLTVTIGERPHQSIPYDAPWSMTGPNGEMIQGMPPMQMPEMPGMPEVYPGFPMIPSGSPMLGILGEALGQEKQLADYFGVEDGVLVKSVNRGSLAEKAGIKAGDVIVKIDNTKVATSRDIIMALRSARNKKAVTVVVVRNKKEMPVTVNLEAGSGMGSPVKAELRQPVYV